MKTLAENHTVLPVSEDETHPGVDNQAASTSGLEDARLHQEAGHWYVVKTKSREESRCISELAKVGIETVCPMVKDYRWRRKRIELVPMFPGYVFARFAYPDNYYQVKWARGVMDVVKFGLGPPLALDKSAVSFFQNRMDKEGVVDTNPEFNPGDPVIFRTDPFKGLIGTILRTDSGKGRILVLLELLYEARIEVDSYQIQPK